MQAKRLFSLLIMLIAGMQIAQADISIVCFNNIRHGEFTQQRVLDAEGRFCSLVKLKTDVKGIMIDATQPRKKVSDAQEQTVYLIEPQSEAHPDEIWIYLSSKTKRFRLYHPVYGGMKEGSSDVRYGYYYLDSNLKPEYVYALEIKSEEGTSSVPPIVQEIPMMAEVQFSAERQNVMMYFDGSRVHAGQTYLAPIGEHSFVSMRPLYKTSRQRINVASGSQSYRASMLKRIPIDLFGGIEMGKPSAYTDLAYGFRAGVICRVGLYASYLTTKGNTVDGAAINPNRLPFEPISPYSDPHCRYDQWSVGLVYRCISSLHVYAGIGQATRSVSWQGLDGMRHEYLNTRQDGYAWEAGLLYNMKRFYLSAGTDCLEGNYGGRVGVGVFLNLLK